MPASWRCDGEKDCEGGADEAGCPTCESRTPLSAKQLGTLSSGDPFLKGACFSVGPGSRGGRIMTRMLETAGPLDMFLFHPHDHLMKSHYHPHFTGEETEAQTGRKRAQD